MPSTVIVWLRGYAVVFYLPKNTRALSAFVTQQNSEKIL